MFIAFGESFASEPGNSDLHRKIIKTRLQTLQNIAAKYHEEERHTPATLEIPDHIKTLLNDPEGVRFKVKQGVRGYNREVWAAENHRRYDESLDKSTLRSVEQGDFVEKLQRIVVVGPEVEQFLGIDSDGTTIGRLSNQEPRPQNPLEHMLGIRLADVKNRIILEKDIDAMAIRVSGPNKLIGTLTDEHGQIHEWTFDLSNGYALTKYQVQVDNESDVGYELIGSKFSIVDGVVLPGVVEKRCYSDLHGDRRVVESSVITIDTFHLNHPDNNLKKYQIQWPDGAHVIDARTNVTYKSQNGILEAVNRGIDDAIHRFNDQSDPLTPPSDDDLNLESIDKSSLIPQSNGPVSSIARSYEVFFLIFSVMGIVVIFFFVSYLLISRHNKMRKI